MTHEEALQKAEQGYQLGIIPFDKIDEYAAYLYKKSQKECEKTEKNG
jgi:hypothetical protein